MLPHRLNGVFRYGRCSGRDVIDWGVSCVMCRDVVWAITEWMSSPSSGNVQCGLCGEHLGCKEVCRVRERLCF